MSDKRMINGKQQIISIAVILLLAAVTIYVLVEQTNQFSREILFGFFQKVNYFYVIGSALCVLLAIFAEGYSLKLIIGKLGYKAGPIQSMMWSAADYYFSGITPSASGGQPASVYFMHKDGIPVSKSSAALVFNILEFSLSLLALGIVSLLIYPQIFLKMAPVAQGFIIYGFVILLVLIAVCLLCMFKRNWIQWLCSGVITLLAKMRLVKTPDQKKAALASTLDDYEGAVKVVKNNPSLVISAFAVNLVQRAATAFTVCLLYLGIGGSVLHLLEIFMLNILCIIAVSSVPIPGAVGVSELVFMIMFKDLLGDHTAAIMLTNRAITFYLCIFFCGIWTLVKTIKVKIEGNKRC